MHWNPRLALQACLRGLDNKWAAQRGGNQEQDGAAALQYQVWVIVVGSTTLLALK